MNSLPTREQNTADLTHKRGPLFIPSHPRWKFLLPRLVRSGVKICTGSYKLVSKHVCSMQGSIQIKIQIIGCPNPTTNQSLFVSESIRPNNSNTKHQKQYLTDTNQYPFEDHRQSKRGIREGSNPRKGTEIPKRYDSKT